MTMDICIYLYFDMIRYIETRLHGQAKNKPKPLGGESFWLGGCGLRFEG